MTAPAPARSWRRLVARVIDGVLVGGVVGAVVWGSAPHGRWGAGVADSTATVIIYFVYEALMLAARGQTLGKMATRIRVVPVTRAGRLGTKQCWIRSAVYHLPLLVWIGALFWLVNVLWHLFDTPNRQCLHDKAADSMVVDA
jgi:uncharacterized RDD family membrane protein YckC